jgi:DNA-binding beta-propeller fold protein YncE
VSEAAKSSCARGRSLGGALGVVASPDGRNVYVTASEGPEVKEAFPGGVAVFKRNAKTGALTQAAGTAGCVRSPRSEGCGTARILMQAGPLALSADGRTLYVGSPYGLTVLARNTSTGALTELSGAQGCLQDATDTARVASCGTVRRLGGPRSIAVSADGKNVYVTSFNGVDLFARDTSTGALTQLAGAQGCLSNASSPATDGCTHVAGLGGGNASPGDVVVSGDGRNVYVAAPDSEEPDDNHSALAIFRRDPATGALTQDAGAAACVSNLGDGEPACTRLRGLSSPDELVIDRTGRNVYVGSAAEQDTGSTLAFLKRDPSTGALTQASGRAGCLDLNLVSTPSGCAPLSTLGDVTGLAISGDGKSVYVSDIELLRGVAAFARTPSTGGLAPLARPFGCLKRGGAKGRCVDARVSFPIGLAVSPDNRNVYVADAGTKVKTGAVSVFARKR